MTTTNRKIVVEGSARSVNIILLTNKCGMDLVNIGENVILGYCSRATRGGGGVSADYWIRGAFREG